MEFNTNRTVTDICTGREYDVNVEAESSESEAGPSLFRWALTSVANTFIQNTVGDIPYLVWNPEKFITTDLYARAKETGVAQAYIGPKLLCDYGFLPTITLVAGDRKMVSQVSGYGDDDPHARDSFEIVAKLYRGKKTIAELTAPQEYKEELLRLKPHLSKTPALERTYSFTLEFIETYFRDGRWDESISVQDHISYLIVNVLGHTVFGIPEVPMSDIHILQEVSRLILSSSPDAAVVAELADKVKAMTDRLMAHENAGTLSAYSLDQLNLGENATIEQIIEGLKELNVAFSLFVESNLSFLIETGILLVRRDSSIQAKLRDELKDFNWDHADAYKHLCHLPYLDCVYNESLRFSTPVTIIDRQVSKPRTIEGKVINGSKAIYHVAGDSFLTPIFGRSRMMVNIAGIHYDPEHWDKPHEFDPSRFEGEEVKSKKAFLMPFSTGKRMCPGGSVEGISYSSTIAKLVIAYFTMNYNLQLKSELKDLRNDTFYRGWEEVFASIQPIDS